MSVLMRERPTPLPEIHPVWEYQATGALHATYEEIKRDLQLPWVGVVVLAYAHYPTFFEVWWNGVKALCQSSVLVDACRELRFVVEDGVAALKPPPIVGRLREAGYSERELDEIRGMIEVFSHGNNMYFPIITVARLLLEGQPLSGDGSSPAPFRGRHAPELPVPLAFMELHHAGEETRTVYEDVKARLGLPFVNSDYRALARWPSYFAKAWGDLRDHVVSPAHEALAQAYHDRAVALIDALPNPGRLTPEALQAAADRDASVDEVLAMTKLFVHLIPGLSVNVAFFRHQLQE